MSSSSTLERARGSVVLITIGMNAVAMVLFSFVPFSNWRTGLALHVLDNAVLMLHAVELRDRFMWRLMLFGLVLGLVELPAAAWLVEVTGTLDYSIGGGPMIWRSPAWMPLGWEILAVQFGYLGTRLIEWRRGWGLLLAGILGAITLLLYAEMAQQVNWWKYANCRMLWHTPHYIILGGFGMVLCLVRLAQLLRSGNLLKAVMAGVLAGLVLFGCYAGAYWLTDRLL